MDRLSDKTLVDIPSYLVRPLYDRSLVPTRIVHLGAGSFFRSHTAVYTDNVMQGGDARWGILGASWHKPTLANALTPQDGLYTLLVTDTGIKKARVVGSIKQVVCMADQRAAVLAALASPSTQIVSLTITPQGYCYDFHKQAIDDSLADVRSDLNEPWNPRTAIGVLAWSIFQRRESGAPPFTLLSCDNMHNNGKVLQRALESYIERVQLILNDSGLLQYFLDRYACPCTLVDRITPPSRPAHLVDVQDMLGLHDQAPVVAEPFSQWVIQDWFSGERPDWDAAEARLTR